MSVRSLAAVVASISTVVALLAIAPAASALPTGSNSAWDRLDVYSGQLTAAQIAKIVALGVDRHELGISGSGAKGGAKGTVRVSAILSGRQVDALRAKGVNLSAKTVNGLTAAQDATTQAADGFNVFKKYAGPGAIKEEFTQTAAAKPAITKLISIGKTVNNQDIIAMKVSSGARQLPDGSKPSVLYIGAQHAREWITPEMIRRLMHYFVDGYATDASIRNLLTQNELWFVPTANPDGYDFTFQDGQRLWRKNLRDNDGDGMITAGDGVDLNRNFPYKWGYDNEGSSDDPSSETYRGTSPGSEPETKAMDAFVKKVKFKFLVNYHSAAELLLYGIGWQVATPSPDDVIYEAIAGDDANPAVPGYDPDISAELYTTNGETDGHVTNLYNTLAMTPEMSTCQDASDANPNDAYEAEDCDDNVFAFPDDEALIQAEFEKNLPFAVAVAKSAKDPSNPVSVVGRTAENFRVDTFDVSYGDPQTVAVTAKRALGLEKMQYRINGGRQKSSFPTEWKGGERYGNEGDDYYHELRGVVTGAKAGDHVEVWFTALKGGLSGGLVASQHFTYTVESKTGAKVLVIADEDYTGVNPDYPSGTNAPKYAAQYRAALTAAGYSSDLWDVDKQGVPHDLGVLSHYKAVVWYDGDNRITQDPEDEETDTPFGPLPDISVAEKEQYLTMSVRDYLNAGGKLIRAGETAGFEGLPGISDVVGGLYYGLNGDPSAECHVDTVAGFFSDCLILANDFRQYYEGAYARTDSSSPVSVSGIANPITSFLGTFGGPVVTGANPLDEAGTFTPTSQVLPVAQFPQFASHAAARYTFPAPSGPFAPAVGTGYAAAQHADNAYMRLTKTIDLTSASSAQLRFQLSANTEPSYDNVIVEAHTVGQDNWTTLPEAGGATSTDPPAECSDPGFLLDAHPFLRHYLGGEDCTAAGTTGTWNAITGDTGGYQQVAYDLAPFLGQQVEVSISYVTD
ncbi:MAG: M14 family metallopeptidase, partial [Mycobacteriales bacterium]